MAAASKESVELLHSALADAFSKILDEGVKVAVTDKETGETTLETVTPPANYLNVVRQFLNDNDIKCGAIKSPALLGLVSRLPSLPPAGSDHPANRTGTED
jgi:hypothetical protein